MIKKSIGLVLSGGGIRAATFHAGVLKWLAVKNELDHIKYISSVSGGSLFIGLVFHFNNYKWPTSKEYLEKVLPSICDLLTKRSLQIRALINLILKPCNWRYIFSRANILSKTIESLWGIKSLMKDLPEFPVWAINGTTGENGKRFRIKKNEIGDYEIGYSRNSNFKIADAISISAAFPVGIGPLTIKTKNLIWEKKSSWNSHELIENYNPPFKKLHLYDGGVYDNLGIEPVFDIGLQKIKNQDDIKMDMILISDASSPLEQKRIPRFYSPFRIQRLMDIMLSQTRSLRVRSIINFIKNNPEKGAYYQLGSNPVKSLAIYGKENDKHTTSNYSYNWLDDEIIQKLSRYKTNLKKINKSNFDNLERHGYETVEWNDILWKIFN